jgi:hypothetical protein
MYNVTGVVRDVQQRPIVNATVTARTPSGPQTATTGSDGSYVIALKNDSYTLTFGAYGFWSKSVDVVVAGNTIVPDVVITSMTSFYATVDYTPTANHTRLVQIYYIIKIVSDEYDICLVTSEAVDYACACADGVAAQTPAGETLTVRNATGCAQPALFFVNPVAYSDDVKQNNVTVTLYEYDAVANTSGLKIATWQRSMAAFIPTDDIWWPIWRVFSITPQAGFLVHDDIVGISTYNVGIPGWL